MIDIASSFGFLTGAVGTVLDIGLIVFAGVAVAVPFIVLIWMMQFKHRVILRKKTKGTTDIVMDTKFRILRKKGKPEMIQLFKTFSYKPLPPPEAFDITTKGKYFCEGYESETGQITWVAVQDKPTKISMDALTSDDKSFYFDLEKDAREQFRQVGFWQFLNNNAGLITLIIIFGMILIFFQDVMAPVNQVGTDLKAAAKDFRAAAEAMDRVNNDQGIIPDDRFPQAPG